MRIFAVLGVVLGLCLAALLPSLAVAADKSDWYQVEVLVFAQTHPNTSEHWDATRLPHYDNQAIHLAGASPALPAAASDAARQAANAGAWQLQSQDNSQAVADMAKRMSASGDFRTLFYGRWQQPIAANQKTLPIYLQGGQQITASTALAAPQPMQSDPAMAATDVPPLDANNPSVDGGITSSAPEAVAATLPELQGTITLSRAHYLHLDTNLWFAANANGQTFFAHINEPRRLKSGELHYLDNPLFGVVIRVTPVDH